MRDKVPTLVVTRSAEGAVACSGGEYAEVAAEPIDHVETLRFRFEPKSQTEVDLVMEFETTRVRVPIAAAAQ